ncbi:MAG TPA: hypothetical protein VMW43_12430 [Bacteroidota bacterium]|nr:hypothetical protein [Bacteroidota bacterium]
MTSGKREGNNLFSPRHSIVFIVVAVAVVFILIRLAGKAGHVSPPPPARPAAASAPPVKQAPKEITFHGCPPEGSGGDGQLNLLKNRIDEGEYMSVGTGEILSYTWPPSVVRRQRAEWPPDDKRAVDLHEGLPVSVEGYLLGAKEEGAESPNCRMNDPADRDFHLWLAGSPDAGREKAIVVEITPRVRAGHPEWTIASLHRLVRAGRMIRISGWLLLDQEHPEQIGRTRGTLWEIHPIMKIEIADSGGWRMMTGEDD